MKSFLGCGQTPCCITNAETFCSVPRFLPGFQSAISNRESAIPSICGRITPWTHLPRCHSESFAVILSEANPPRRVALDFSADKQQGSSACCHSESFAVILIPPCGRRISLCP